MGDQLFAARQGNPIQLTRVFFLPTQDAFVPEVEQLVESDVRDGIDVRLLFRPSVPHLDIQDGLIDMYIFDGGSVICDTKLSADDRLQGTLWFEDTTKKEYFCAWQKKLENGAITWKEWLGFKQQKTPLVRYVAELRAKQRQGLLTNASTPTLDAPNMEDAPTS